jgi:hypothetical protein
VILRQRRSPSLTHRNFAVDLTRRFMSTNDPRTLTMAAVWVSRQRTVFVCNRERVAQSSRLQSSSARGGLAGLADVQKGQALAILAWPAADSRYEREKVLALSTNSNRSDKCPKVP